MAARALLLVLAGLFVAPPALGQGDVERAKRHVEQAEEHYQLAEFDDAVREFKAAYRLVPRPGILFNLGQCYLQLQDYAKADFSYRAYLRAAPEAQNRALVEELIEQAAAAREEEERLRLEAEAAARVSSSSALLGAGLTTASLGASVALVSLAGVGLVELLLLSDAESTRESWRGYEVALGTTAAMGIAAVILGGTLGAVALVE